LYLCYYLLYLCVNNKYLYSFHSAPKIQIKRCGINVEYVYWLLNMFIWHSELDFVIVIVFCYIYFYSFSMQVITPCIKCATLKLNFLNWLVVCGYFKWVSWNQRTIYFIKYSSCTMFWLWIHMLHVFNVEIEKVFIEDIILCMYSIVHDAFIVKWFISSGTLLSTWNFFFDKSLCKYNESMVFTLDNVIYTNPFIVTLVG